MCNVKICVCVRVLYKNIDIFLISGYLLELYRQYIVKLIKSSLNYLIYKEAKIFYSQCATLKSVKIYF